jgi:uncharacterized protein YeaO (DUF488 family)
VISIKRVYEPVSPVDGRRFLVERLWPRGVRTEAAAIEAWRKEVSPSPDLRVWYGHDPARWDEFQERYRAELIANPAAWQPLLEAARTGPVTLVYSARDPERNSAALLKVFLDRQLEE